MAENTSFVEVLEIFSSPETNKSDVKIWCSLSFPISIHLWVKKSPIKTSKLPKNNFKKIIWMGQDAGICSNISTANPKNIAFPPL